MKVRKTMVLAGTLAVALVLGMVLLGCRGNDRGIIGTWETTVWGTSLTVIFHRDGRFEMVGGGLHYRGTFTARNGQIAFFYDGDEEDEEGTYTITGNTLILAFEGEAWSLQRQ